jgi:hypothetical protein
MVNSYRLFKRGFLSEAPLRAHVVRTFVLGTNKEAPFDYAGGAF